MKKFLTVLLALSVVFTYSFSTVGTAFAADAPANSQTQYLANLDKAEKQALDNAAKEYNLAKSQVTYNGDEPTTGVEGGYVIAVSEWLKQLDVMYEAEKKAIQATTVTLQTKEAYESNGDKSVDELTALYTVTGHDQLVADLYADSGEYAINAAKSQFAIDKAQIIANANSVDTTIYSTTEQTTAYPEVKYGNVTVNTKVPKEYADAIVAKAAYELGEIKLAGTEDSATAVKAKKDELVAKLAEYIKYDEAKKVYILDEEKVGDILSVAEEKQQDAEATAGKAAALAKLAVNISDAAVATVNLDADSLAAWVKLKDAYNTVCTYLINAGDLDRDSEALAQFPAYTITKVNGVTTANETATHYQEAVADMENVASLAAALKAKTNIDGEPEYDAAKVDKLLEDAYKTQYAKATQAAAYVPCTEDFSSAKLEYSSSFTKEHEKAAVAATVNAEEMTYKGTAYYALEWADVVAAVNAFNAAIDAAETKTDIDKAKKALDDATKADKIKPATAIDELYATGGVCNTAAVDALAMVNNEVAALNAGKVDAETIENPFVTADDPTGQKELNKWFAEKNARTDAEVKALYGTLKAEVAKTPTKAAKKAASEAAVANVKAMIDKLPTALNATLADADAAIEAKKAFDKLSDAEQGQIPAEESKLNALIENLVALYDAEIEKQIAEAQKGGITAEDAPIFDELEALNDTYKELAGNDNAKYTQFADTAGNADKLRDAEAEVVIDDINALPESITLADKPAVEEARAEFDAYVEKYTDYVKGDNAANDIPNYAKLVSAEEMIKVLEVSSVESLKITVSTKLYKGSKIRVNWTVKGDPSTIDYYQVYKSTKAQKGYQFMGKTKKNYMDNKKNLKKGTRYYYKVRAYKVVDGVNHYSDWSNKGNRIYK